MTSGPPRSLVPTLSDDDAALAECRNHPDVSFFPERHRGATVDELDVYRVEVARAKAVCDTCPVKQPCLDMALSAPGHDLTGILGGTTARERKRMRKDRR